MSEQANTINVVNPEGDLVSLPNEQVQAAVKAGYRIPAPQEEHALKLKSENSGGLANTLKAGAYGAARGLTFGASDQIATKGFGQDPEQLKALEEGNPEASTIGNVAGAVLPLIASEGLSAGAGAVKGGAALAEGAGTLGAEALASGATKGALGAAAEYAPTTLASNAAHAVTEAATPFAQKAVGLAINPETSPIAHKILSSGLASGMGSAVEGAAYGLGQSISEDALGDPDAMGEHLMSNIGYGALLGGAGGALFGGGEAAFSRAKNKVPSVGEMLDKEAPKTFEDAVNDGHFSQEEKEGVLAGIKKQKENAPQIKKAAEDLGVDSFIPQISGSDGVLHTHEILTNSPSVFGEMERQKIQNAIETVAGKVKDTIAPETAPQSLAQMGESLKDSLGERFKAEYKPTKDLYDYLGENSKGVPITSKSTAAIKRNILKIIDDESLISGTAAHGFIQNVANSLEQVTDLATLRNFRTNLYKQAPMEAKWVAGIIKEKLDNLETNAVKRLATTMKTSVAKEKILGLLDAADQAKSGYKKLYERMNEFGDVLGKKIHGPQDFLNYLADGNTSERFAEKLFQKKNSAFTTFFKENFPKEWETISGYQKNKILQANMKDGALNINATLKAVNKLEPEMRAALFNKAELKTLDNAKTYMDAFPKKWNGSNTAHAAGWMHSLQNPVSAAITTARDYAIKTGFEKLGLSSAQMASVETLSKVERATNSTTSAISSGAKSLFGAASKALPATSVLTLGSNNNSDKSGTYAHIESKLNEVNQNPTKAMDNMENATQWIYHAAPKTSGGLQMAMGRAHGFLGSKLPTIQKSPLTGKLNPSPAEISKFNRYFETVKDPTHVFQKMKTGMLMPEHMETLQTVYPKMLEQMQAAVTDELTNKMNDGSAEALPYKTKMMLSMFLGNDLVSSVSQASIAANQMHMTGEKNKDDQLVDQNAAPPTQAGMKNLSLSDRSQTAMQSIAQGDQTS